MSRVLTLSKDKLDSRASLRDAASYFVNFAETFVRTSREVILPCRRVEERLRSGRGELAG